MPNGRMPVSSKGEGHGYGMRNIQACCERSQGSLYWEATEDSFLSRTVVQVEESL